jgi:hypothetical protein
MCYDLKTHVIELSSDWLLYVEGTFGESRDIVVADFGDLEASTAETDAGSCKACLTASISPLERAGFGEFRRGGRGGGGVLTSILNVARGGGGNGPAVAWVPMLCHETGMHFVEIYTDLADSGGMATYRLLEKEYQLGQIAQRSAAQSCSGWD